MTAVEWLEDMIAKMEAYGGDLPPLMIHIKKAKEMEKQQQEKICDSIQRIRASKSDAEARRIIRTI